MGVIVLGLSTPLPAKATTEYPTIEYSYVVAINPAIIPQSITQIEYKTSNHKVLKHYPSPLGLNCVEYAKSRKAIGTGYRTLQQKISKIRTKKATVGAIGVTREGPVGHMVYVEEVKDETIVVSEGNWIRGHISFREVPKNLILGYL